MPDVVLIWIDPSPADYRERKVSSDLYLGLGYLKAHLATNGIDAHIELFRSEPVATVAERVANSGCSVVGLSLKDTNFYAARWLASEIRAVAPEVTIVAGGLTATFSDDFVLTHARAIDACVLGFGETTFTELVRRRLARQDWRDLASVSFRTTTGAVHRNPAGRPPSGRADLDYLPSPYLSGALPLSAALRVGISTSRGCTHRCTFCNPTAMAGFAITYHTDERTLAEVVAIDDDLQRSGSQGMVFLSEDTFALSKGRTRRLCRKLAELQLKAVTFGCETRIEHLDASTLELMYDAGFRFLKFGLESASPRVLNVIKKVRAADGTRDDYAVEKRFLQQITSVTREAKKIGFHLAAGAIFGLPTETFDDAIQTLDFIARSPIDEYYHNYLQLFAGTEIFHTYQQYGYQLSEWPDHYPTIYRTTWPYPVELVPRIEEKLTRAFPRHAAKTVVTL